MDFKELFLSRIETSIITEAFQASSMAKVLDLVGRYLTKTFGSQAKWANDGDINAIVIAGQKLFSISYYFANGSEIRLGFKTISGGSFSIVRIDYWKPGFIPVKHNSAGVAIADYTITFAEDVSVAQIFPKILPAIKNIIAKGSAGKTVEILIRPKGAEAITEGEKHYTGSKSDIVRQMLKAGESKDAIYAQIGNDASAKSLVSKIGKELGIVVTAKITPAGNKSETVSPSTSAMLKKGYKLVPKYSEASVYEDMKYLFDATIIKRKFLSLLLSGSPGVGKTFSLFEFLKEHGLKSSDENPDNPDYIVLKGGRVSTLFLYETMFDYKEHGKLIIVDDADSVLDNPETNMLLKGALDTSETRNISWSTKHPKIFTINGRNPIRVDSEAYVAELDDGKFPNTFQYDGQMIIISNKHVTELDPAVRSRCICVDITIKSTDIINRVDDMLKEGKTIGGLNKDALGAALNFMKKMPGNNEKPGELWPGTELKKDEWIPMKEDTAEVNFRNIMAVAKFANLGYPPAVWQRLAIKYAGLPAEFIQ